MRSPRGSRPAPARRRPSPRRRPNDSTARCLGPQRRSRTDDRGCAAGRAGMAAAGDDPVRWRRPCAGGCGSIWPRTPGSSAWRAWCSAATAMGETVHDALIDDLIEVRRAGELILHDRDPASPARWLRCWRGGRSAPGRARRRRSCMSAPEAEARLDAVREALARARGGRFGMGWHAACAHRGARWRVPARSGRGRIERLARWPSAAARLVVLRTDEPDAA